MLEIHFKLCVTKPDFFNKIALPPKREKCAQNVPKMTFLNLLKNLVISFFRICCTMKAFIICYVTAQSSCLGRM